MGFEEAERSGKDGPVLLAGEVGQVGSEVGRRGYLGGERRVEVVVAQNPSFPEALLS